MNTPLRAIKGRLSGRKNLTTASGIRYAKGLFLTDATVIFSRSPFSRNQSAHWIDICIHRLPKAFYDGVA